MKLDRRHLVTAAAALVVGAGMLGGAATSTAQAEPSPSATDKAATATAPATPGPAPTDEVRGGTAVADEDATNLTREVQPETSQTRDGAVEAFTAFAGWLTSSPAVKEEPQLAVEALGENLLNPGEAQMLANMQRADDMYFDIDAGGYRVLAHSGDQARPDQVMLEVAAPLRNAGKSRWIIAGGVVAWRDDAWQLVSIMPREVEQPEAVDTAAEELSLPDQSKVFDGLGWKLFAEPGQ